MQISKIGNLNFNAKAEGALKAEIIQKRNKIISCRYLNTTMLVRFDEYIKEIEDILPDATVTIDDKNPNFYRIIVPVLVEKGEKGSPNYKVERKNRVFIKPRYIDKDFYHFNYLRTALKYIEKRILSEKK